MKKVNYLITIGVFLLSTSLILSGCKKKSSTPDYPSPLFIATYTLVTLQTGDAGVEFFANCTTTDVKLTKVEILDPIHSGIITYNLQGLTVVKGQIFAMQDANTAYLKQGGQYQFTFTGNRSVDNAGFSVVTTLNVAK